MLLCEARKGADQGGLYPDLTAQGKLGEGLAETRAADRERGYCCWSLHGRPGDRALFRRPGCYSRFSRMMAISLSSSMGLGT